MDQDSHWGTFPVGFLPFFAFSLPNTSRKADLGAGSAPGPPLQPLAGLVDGAPRHCDTPGQQCPAAEVERSVVLFCFAPVLAS